MARPKLDAPNFKLVRRGSRYYVRWWQDGAWHRVSTGTEDERAARRFLAQFSAGHAAPLPPEQPTIGTILDGYLADRKGEVRSFETLEAAAKAIRRHLGDLEPGHLTDERGKLYARQRRAEGHMIGPANARKRKPTSNGTITREIVTLRAALRWAIRKQWISVEPYVAAPAGTPPKDRWLTRDEYDRLVERAVAMHVKLFIALALHTGARSAAILSLTWDQVDLRTRLIRFGPAVGNKGRATVPINDDLLEALQVARQAATSASVIAHGDRAVASIKTGFQAACRRAKLPDVTPHVLRHTAATWMAIAGIPMREIALYLGHASTATTERVYSHHSPDFLRRAGDALLRVKRGPVAPKTGG